MLCLAEDSGESSEDGLESEQSSDAEPGSVEADGEQQSGEAAFGSDAEAEEAGPSNGNAEPQQQSSPPGGQKRKQAFDSASKKRAKISITLGKGGGAQGHLVCHVSVVALWLSLCRFQPVSHAYLAALLLPEHCTFTAGVWQAWTQCRLPGLCVCGLPQQALLSV